MKKLKKVPASAEILFAGPALTAIREGGDDTTADLVAVAFDIALVPLEVVAWDPDWRNEEDGTHYVILTNNFDDSPAP
jgi:hypothetical protein